MLRLLIDQDLDQVILRGLLLRVPGLDVVTAHQASLSDASDADLLDNLEIIVSCSEVSDWQNIIMHLPL